MRIKPFWNRYRRNRMAVVGLILLMMTFLTALFAQVLAPYPPMRIIVGPPLTPPSTEYLLGTDDLGRDILSQVIWGTRISLMVGFAAEGIATLIGISMGSIAGYYRRYIDKVSMGLTDVFLIIPDFALALTMVALYGSNYVIVILVIAVTGWPSTARLVRAEYLSHRERAYVEAAQSIGLKDRNIILGEILPNAMPPVIVNSSIGVAQAILLEAGLSFLGAGDPNVVSWGWMLKNAFQFIHTSWWMITVPGFALFITAVSLNLIGDGLNDALNPRLKHL